MRAFAEAEVVIPDGPFQGRRFRCDRQPWSGLWFDAIDSDKYQRFAATGPSQSGKTLSCYVIPTMYHLFEIGETVVCGVPKMDMAHDKWEQDFLPAIRASRFADLLPTKGRGSRGGTFDSITFRNGATLRFMTGGGDDKSRAGFTSRVVVVTEVDGLDKSSELSREADPIKQLEARTRAYGSRRRIYLECTVSTKDGRIWQEYSQGTESKIVAPCPHCGRWITPERKDMLGWDGAVSEFEAEERGQFFCPLDGCAAGLSEQQRVEANRAARLIHRGQVVGADGEVAGEMPQTRTLGFRWSAFNNLFISSGELAAEEWKSSREADEENANRERNQFVWCVPADAAEQSVTELHPRDIIQRQGEFERGVLPTGCQAVTAFIDVGKHLLHWTAKGWSPEPFGYTVDYGVEDVYSREMGEEVAILSAIRKCIETLMGGFPQGDVMRKPAAILVDSGNWTTTVYAACLEARAAGYPVWPAKGFGSGVFGRINYSKPSGVGQKVTWIGDGMHVVRETIDGRRLELVEINADEWKSKTHSRLECDKSKPGAILLFKADSKEHWKYSQHLTAEKKTEEFVVGKGWQTKWAKVSKANHWLDSEAGANAAAELIGVRVVQLVKTVKPRMSLSAIQASKR